MQLLTAGGEVPARKYLSQRTFLLVCANACCALLLRKSCGMHWLQGKRLQAMRCTMRCTVGNHPVSLPQLPHSSH